MCKKQVIIRFGEKFLTWNKITGLYDVTSKDKDKDLYTVSRRTVISLPFFPD